MVSFTLFFVAPAFGQVCKSTQYDMLKWMAPQPDTKNGHYNMVYPMSGTFYWVKSSSDIRGTLICLTKTHLSSITEHADELSPCDLQRTDQMGARGAHDSECVARL